MHIGVVKDPKHFLDLPNLIISIFNLSRTLKSLLSHSAKTTDLVSLHISTKAFTSIFFNDLRLLHFLLIANLPICQIEL